MVIVAGIGCRKGTDADAIVAAVRAAERASGMTVEHLATGHLKAGEAGMRQAASALSLSLEIVSLQRLEAVASKVVTLSQVSLDHAGSPSVSEASALAAGGENARLVVPRIVVGNVTVAIAADAGASAGSGRATVQGEEE